MTIFVVSLSAAKEQKPRPNPPSRTGSTESAKQGSLSLFSSQNHSTGSLAGSIAGPTPPLSPKIYPEDELFPPTPDTSITSQPSTSHNPNSISFNDAFPNPWGSSRVFNQPRSRASSPPPASILNHTKGYEHVSPTERPSRWTRSSTDRAESYDRAFQRAQWTVEPSDQGNGGLTNAVRAAEAAESLAEKTWVGTLGMPTDALDAAKKTEIADRLGSEFDALTVFVSDNDFDGHYSAYCKTMLWPVFHYQIPDNPKSKAYQDHSWGFYVKINQAFADTIIKDWKRGDTIWIHDYHLLLVPAMIRQKLPDAKIGFFLHTAFPSSEVFRCLAVRKELLEGMLGANLIGFQNDEYRQHFLQTANRILFVEATAEGIQLEDRFVAVIKCPIGIDPTALDAKRADTEVAHIMHDLRERYANKRLIVARDKLDSIRGVRQKLLAYELFLNKYGADLRDKVVLIQVATSTTEQDELEATIAEIATRINSVHSTLAHQPLVFLKQDINFPQYLALMSVADALMVTSLREGMNLTSHEYICCQDGKFGGHKHGSLILSEFTGSTSVFGGNELSVNPWDYLQCADAIRIALEMSPTEKETRWQKLHDILMQNTAANWFTKFVQRLDKAWYENLAREPISIPRFSVNEVGQKYKKASSRLFVLDYEGTLVPPTNAIRTSPQRTLDALNNILEDDKNIVYVVSGRTPEELDMLFRRVPNLGLIAENGCFIKEYATDDWIELADAEKMDDWKDSVRGILDYYQERAEGSWIEERHCSLIFHYSDVEDKENATSQAGECASHINEACENQRVRALAIDNDVYVEPLDWNRGTAAMQIYLMLRKRKSSEEGQKPDFLLVAGDSREDEVVFKWANSLAKEGKVQDVTTVSVGARNTEAMTTLTQGVSGVLTALQKLAALSTRTGR
ncbi:MAG: hypothetical protein M1834_006368 [Cirrosporium novae-zelandiae]|nr:MAG: hypothetical protein M1834_006368 [Cirrosporium novae-zelandiae]